jgi:hypothetical protein
VGNPVVALGVPGLDELLARNTSKMLSIFVKGEQVEMVTESLVSVESSNQASGLIWGQFGTLVVGEILRSLVALIKSPKKLTMLLVVRWTRKGWEQLSLGQQSSAQLEQSSMGEVQIPSPHLELKFPGMKLNATW